MADKKPFTFAISLSVLEHLGRHLYRSFATVLGEAISNAWDADAKNVWITLDPDKNGFWIKDDGLGMTADDFQEKFLKIGYSKRKSGKSKSKSGRPFIGRKGIGKLALLSCAQRISVISKTTGGKYVGGTIDNPSLDDAIKDDLKPDDYPLIEVDVKTFAKYTRGHSQGTIIRFEELKGGVKHSFEFMRKIIALYFRFSLLDKSFRIFVNGKEITHKDLKDLVDKTEFLWKIGAPNDPLIKALDQAFAKEKGDHETGKVKLAGVTGFIASVEKPKDLRASEGLYNVVAKGFEPSGKSKAADRVDRWVDDLGSDAAFNFESYAECFVSENLVRKYIGEKGIALSSEAKAEATKWKEREKQSRGKGNISIQIRRVAGDLSYLSMDDLANLVDKRDKNLDASLSRDASEFKPIRDAVAHTALLTEAAKAKLTTVRENIKGRVKTLLSEKT